MNSMTRTVLEIGMALLSLLLTGRARRSHLRGGGFLIARPERKGKTPTGIKKVIRSCSIQATSTT